MSESGGGVVITGKEMYDLMLETKNTVTRIETTMSALAIAVAEHEQKIDDLTKKYYMAGGLGGIVGAILTAVIPVVAKFIGG